MGLSRTEITQVAHPRNFNVHAEAHKDGAAQDLAAMIIMVLSQIISVPTHQETTTLDLVFCLDSKGFDLNVGLGGWALCY